METEIPVEAQLPEQSSPPPHVTSPTGSLNPEQRAKLQSELDVVQSNMNVLGEMLSEMKPGNEQPDELELLQVSLLNFDKNSLIKRHLCDSTSDER